MDQSEAARVPLRLHGSAEVSAASGELCRVMMSAVREFGSGALTKERVELVLLDFRRASQAALAQARTDLDLT